MEIASDTDLRSLAFRIAGVTPAEALGGSMMLALAFAILCSVVAVGLTILDFTASAAKGKGWEIGPSGKCAVGFYCAAAAALGIYLWSQGGADSGPSRFETARRQVCESATRRFVADPSLQRAAGLDGFCTDQELAQAILEASPPPGQLAIINDHLQAAQQ